MGPKGFSTHCPQILAPLLPADLMPGHPMATEAGLVRLSLPRLITLVMITAFRGGQEHVTV